MTPGAQQPPQASAAVGNEQRMFTAPPRFPPSSGLADPAADMSMRTNPNMSTIGGAAFQQPPNTVTAGGTFGYGPNDLARPTQPVQPPAYYNGDVSLPYQCYQQYPMHGNQQYGYDNGGNGPPHAQQDSSKVSPV